MTAAAGAAAAKASKAAKPARGEARRSSRKSAAQRKSRSGSAANASSTQVDTNGISCPWKNGCQWCGPGLELEAHLASCPKSKTVKLVKSARERKGKMKFANFSKKGALPRDVLRHGPPAPPVETWKAYGKRKGRARAGARQFDAGQTRALLLKSLKVVGKGIDPDFGSIFGLGRSSDRIVATTADNEIEVVESGSGKAANLDTIFFPVMEDPDTGAILPTGQSLVYPIQSGATRSLQPITFNERYDQCETGMRVRSSPSRVA